MENRRQSVEAMVGILVIFGLLAIGFLVVKFGKVGGKLQEHYNLTVEMKDATGIRAGVPVRLGGLQIGQVSGPPRLKVDYSAMEVPLEIYIEIRIPRDSRVTIGSAGLMGDNYVRFSLPTAPSNQFIEPGTFLVAGPAVGLKALQDDAEGVLNNVNDSVSELNTAIESLDRIFTKVETLLGDGDTGDLRAAITDLSEMASTANQAAKKLDPLLGSADEVIKDFQATARVFRDSSAKLDPLFTSAEDTFSEVRKVAGSAQEMIDSAGVTFKTGNEAIQDLAKVAENAEPTLEEIQLVLQTFRETLARVDHFTTEAESNDGLLKAFRDDPELKRDFKSLVKKLEVNGIIFYPRDKDREPRPIFSNPSTRRN